MDSYASPLITGETLGGHGPVWAYNLALLGIVLLIVGLTYLLCTDTELHLKHLRRRLTVGTVVSCLGASLIAIPLVEINDYASKPERTVDHAALATLITDRYTVEAPRPVAEPEPGEGSEEIAALCGPFTPDSLEMQGFHEGQQLTFKVAADCQSNSPKVELVVTDAPGQPLSAGDLER